MSLLSSSLATKSVCTSHLNAAVEVQIHSEYGILIDMCIFLIILITYT